MIQGLVLPIRAGVRSPTMEIPSARLPASIFALQVIYAAYQVHSYVSRLPDVMATHFGGLGTPNGWQTIHAFFVTDIVVVVLATVVGFGVPLIIGVVPVSLINLPNKQSWLAPERRANTLAYLRVHFAWFGCALLAFLLFVNELVFRANLVTPRRLNSTAFTAALVAFLAFVLVWTIRVIRHFVREPKQFGS
jgi:hypothetical protein